MFNIEEFQAAFTTEYCSISNFNFQGESIYIVRLYYTESALKKTNYYIRLYRNDPAMYITVPT